MCPFRSSQAEGTDNHVKPSFAPKRTDGLTGQLKSPDTPTVLLTISQLRDCCPASRQHHQPLPPGMSRPVSLDLPGSRACPRPSHPVKTSPCTSSSLCVSELASPCQGLGQRRNPNGRDAVSRAPPPPPPRPLETMHPLCVSTDLPIWTTPGGGPPSHVAFRGWLLPLSTVSTRVMHTPQGLIPSNRPVLGCSVTGRIK